MTEQPAADLLKNAESYLSALHGSVARHDNLAANLACAGCELRDQIRAELRRMADQPAAVQPPAADRAAIYREVADRLAADAEQGDKEGLTRIYRRSAAKQVRTWADEAQQPEAVAGRAGETPATETEAQRRENVEYFLQAQQDDGTWEDASSFMNALDWATERLAGKRAKYPDFTWRLAQRTTTVTVKALPDCLVCRHWSCDGNGPCGALLDAWQRCACAGPPAAASGAAAAPAKEA